MTAVEMQRQALSNATQSSALTNYPAIYAGFMEKGIPESEIRPRENVFTFHAWKALGRSVRKGEHGVRIVTWIPVSAKIDAETGERRDGYKRPKSTTVFHISQTEPSAVVEG